MPIPPPQIVNNFWFMRERGYDIGEVLRFIDDTTININQHSFDSLVQLY